MSANLVPQISDPPSSLTTGRSLGALSRQTRQALGRLGDSTTVRLASVQAEGLVQSEKLHEVDHLTQAAMSGHALLSKWRDVLGSADPLLHDDITFLLNLSRLAKAEILTDSIDAMRRL